MDDVWSKVKRLADEYAAAEKVPTEQEALDQVRRLTKHADLPETPEQAAIFLARELRIMTAEAIGRKLQMRPGTSER